MSNPPNKRTFVRIDTPLEPTKKKRAVVLVKKTAERKSKRAPTPTPTPIEPVRPYLDEQGRVICPSCGRKIHVTELREHLGSEHRFTKAQLALLEVKGEYKAIWVQVWQGGLPGLGKHH